MSQDVMGETSWILGVHNHLRDLLTDAPQALWKRRGHRKEPQGLLDVIVFRPRIRMIGWSGAPQVAGRGQAHVLHAVAYGSYRSQRVGYAQWVCSGHSTYPVLGDPTELQQRCRKCFLLAQG